MSTPTPRGQRPGVSPFDAIMRTDTNPDGSVIEWWSARQLMPELGYERWDSFTDTIDRARTSARIQGLDPGQHFKACWFQAPRGNRGGTQPVEDVQLTRHACHLVAMCGDVRKRQIASAQAYFSIQTFRAEQLLPPVASPVIPVFPASQLVPPAQPRPWYERIRETWMPHIRRVNRDHPESFTVVTELAVYVMQMEDELHYHEVVTRSSDRPDVSIGSRWARYRRDVLGYPDAASSPLAGLYLPDQDITVELKVYPESERNTFRRWFFDVYLREAYLDYIDHKKEWRRDVPALTRASVADVTCEAITGRPAALPAPRRNELGAALPPAGGRVPVSRALPGSPSPRLNPRPHSGE